jgi:formamidopyrimidine-DNA glycosylase
MPELPELIHLSHQVKRYLHQCYYRDSKVIDVFVLGKELAIILENGKMIKIHLMLKGRLVAEPKSSYLTKIDFTTNSGEIKSLFLIDNMRIAKITHADYHDEVPLNLHDNTIKDILLSFINNKRTAASIILKIPGIGAYLLSEILGYSNLYPLEVLQESKVNIIVTTMRRLIPEIVSKHGKYSYTDLYNNNGSYVPKYYENSSMNKIKYLGKIIYTKR